MLRAIRLTACFPAQPSCFYSPDARLQRPGEVMTAARDCIPEPSGLHRDVYMLEISGVCMEDGLFGPAPGLSSGIHALGVERLLAVHRLSSSV